MATLQNIGKLKYRGKDGLWRPLPVVVQDTGGGVSTISGKGAPTSETQGKVNQLYRDEDTQKLYICTATDGGYTWAEVSGGGSVDVDATLTKAGQAADAKVAGDAIGKKIDKSQGTGNAGKILGIGADGNVTPQDKPVQALSGAAAPTTATAGVVGQEYYVIVNNAVTEMYVCTAVANGTYTWGKVEFGAEIDDTSTEPTKVWSAEKSAEKCNQLSEKIAELGGTLVEPAEDDIPKVFFGGALQQTKDVAVVPFRYISKTRDISGYAEIKAQGNSSMSYPKKNQTVKIFMDADCTEMLKVDFKGWGAQNKHVYKANWIDLSHARNVVSARLWADVVKSRAGYENLPELLRTSPNQGAVDGFPVKVYAAGVYQGRYTLNIPKDKWAFNMDDTLDNHCVLCGENYASGCFRAAANINGNDWSDEIHDVVPVSIKTRWNEVISFVMNSTDDEFKMNLGQYFDIQSLIDYHLFGLQSCGLDAYGKNQIYMTYDGQKWIASMYDMDSTWGLYWNGSKFVATDYARTSYEDFVSTGSSGEGNLLYIRLEQLFWEELQTRWAELKNGALSIENIINRFERFTDISPADLVAEDYANTTGGGSFTNIPSKTTNNIQQIRSFALARQAWCDEYIAGLTPSEEVPCTGISLSSETLTFTEAGTQTLTVTVEPEGCTDTVTWESSDTGVATVSGGIVTAVGNGGATITAICGGFYATCAVSVSGIISGETSLVYSLPESTTFDGTNYIDTGIQLFDTLKDFTILFDYEEGANIVKATILHCIKEISPWPGLSIQRNSGNVGDYVVGGRSSGGVNFANIKSVATRVAITCTGGSITRVKYVKNGDIVTNSISANSGTIFEKNLLLGCYQTDSGTKGRYWEGTINKFDVYFSVLSDEEIDAWLTGK